MKLFGRFFYICVAVMFTHMAHAQDDLVEIIIPHNQYSLTPVVDIYINNHGPYKFVVDTGATQSSISRDLADEIDLTYKKQDTFQVLRAKGVAFPDVTDNVDFYISKKKVHRNTNLLVADYDFNSATKARGILGTAQLQNGILINNPLKKQIEITIPEKSEPCEILNRSSFCFENIKDISYVDFSLGGKQGDLILDTGNQEHRTILMFKSEFTNKIWLKHSDTLLDVANSAGTDKTLKYLRTSNFSIKGRKCSGEILIRNPEDGSPLFERETGIIGWPLLETIPFQINYQTNETKLDLKKCPYEKIKTIGISGIYSSKDFQYMYVDDFIAGSSADEVGLKRHDQVEKIILSDGKVITKFDHTLYNYNDQHVYAPVGSKVTYFVRRDDVLKPFVMTAEGIPLIELD